MADIGEHKHGDLWFEPEAGEWMLLTRSGLCSFATETYAIEYMNAYTDCLRREEEIK